MNKYYAIISTTDNSISKGQCPCSGENILCLEITQEIYDNIDHYIYQNGELVFDENWEEKEKQKEREQFLKDFFNTSLGYVRRQVTMANGETKSFLTDILPLLQVDIPILTYTEDGEQHKVMVTEDFINECKQQVLVDFYGV